MMYNTVIRDNTPTSFEVRRRLEEQIPSRWRLGAEQIETPRGPDMVVDLEAPDGRRITLVVEIKSRLDPVTVPRVREQMQAWTTRSAMSESQVAYVIAAPFLSERTREKLRESGLNYLDLTGNVFLSVTEPGILIRTQGASKDPDRVSRPGRSLRGAKAAKIVRALVDYRSPIGVRRIAQIAGTDPGHVSRLLRMLEGEDLVRRSSTGGVQEVVWDGLLVAWARDYSLMKSNRAYTYLDPRGLDNFLKRLRELSSEVSYAVTGSMAAGRRAPVAPARLGIAFVRDAPAAADALGLVPTEAGANVLLIEPQGDFVFERTVLDEGLTYVAPSQAVADLLTGPGRNPSEGEELLDWMRRNENAWRA